MSEEKKQYEYRFLTDDSFSVIKTIDLGAGLNQIWECLVSEGVPLQPFSVVKCMDIYLRLIGLCRGKEDEFLSDIMCHNVSEEFFKVGADECSFGHYFCEPM